MRLISTSRGSHINSKWKQLPLNVSIITLNKKYFKAKGIFNTKWISLSTSDPLSKISELKPLKYLKHLTISSLQLQKFSKVLQKSPKLESLTLILRNFQSNRANKNASQLLSTMINALQKNKISSIKCLKIYGSNIESVNLFQNNYILNIPFPRLEELSINIEQNQFHYYSENPNYFPIILNSKFLKKIIINNGMRYRTGMAESPIIVKKQCRDLDTLNISLKSCQFDKSQIDIYPKIPYQNSLKEFSLSLSTNESRGSQTINRFEYLQNALHDLKLPINQNLLSLNICLSENLMMYDYQFYDQIILKHIKSAPNLKKLAISMRRNDSSDTSTIEATNQIIDSLPNSVQEIKFLEIERSTIFESIITEILEVKTIAQRIQVLTLECSLWGYLKSNDDVLDTLNQSLSNYENLKEFNLKCYYKPFAIEGLTILSMLGCLIINLNVEKISIHLSELKEQYQIYQLRRIRFSGGDENLDDYIESYQQAIRESELNLRHFEFYLQIDPKIFLNCILPIISSASKLETLKITSFLCDDNLEELQNAIFAQNRSILKELQLTYFENSLTDKGLQDIQKILESANNIEKLILGNNRTTKKGNMTEKGFQNIIQAIFRSYKITYLQLSLPTTDLDDQFVVNEILSMLRELRNLKIALVNIGPNSLEDILRIAVSTSVLQVENLFLMVHKNPFIIEREMKNEQFRLIYQDLVDNTSNHYQE